jgi:hypothetical protein
MMKGLVGYQQCGCFHSFGFMRQEWKGAWRLNPSGAVRDGMGWSIPGFKIESWGTPRS